MNGGQQSSAAGEPAAPPVSTSEPNSAGGAPGAAGSGSESLAGTAGTPSRPAPEPAPAMARVFVAQGHHGRLTVSCDGGATWRHDHSQDDSVRCFVGVDCDHEAFAARGIAFGQGTFVVTWGWGTGATVQRSTNALTWQLALENRNAFADIAFGSGLFVTGGDTHVSADGTTWAPGGNLNINVNYRSIDYVPYDGGRFIVTGESGNARVIVVSRDGQSWAPSQQRPAECISEVRGVAYGNGVLVLSGAKSDVCVSSDGGNTWTYASLGSDYPASKPVWNGTEFILWVPGKVFRSADGVSWSSEATIPNNVRVGAVAIDDRGTIVASNSGWMEWYEKQQFYRSLDGKNWQVLPSDAFVGSHPINFIEAGRVTPSTDCPAESP